MYKTLMIAILSLGIAGVASAVPCPSQPSTLLATNGELSVCADEAYTGVQIERNGVADPAILPIVLAPGVPVKLTGFVMCGTGTLKVRGINAAGASPYGAATSATFPGCVSPKLGGPLP